MRHPVEAVKLLLIPIGLALEVGSRKPGRHETYYRALIWCSSCWMGQWKRTDGEDINQPFTRPYELRLKLEAFFNHADEVVGVAINCPPVRQLKNDCTGVAPDVGKKSAWLEVKRSEKTFVVTREQRHIGLYRFRAEGGVKKSAVHLKAGM
jgi:hypothetical protein